MKSIVVAGYVIYQRQLRKSHVSIFNARTDIFCMSIKFYLIFCFILYNSVSGWRQCHAAASWFDLWEFVNFMKNVLPTRAYTRFIYLRAYCMCQLFSIYERSGKELMDFRSFPETTEQIFHTTLIGNMPKDDNMLLKYGIWTNIVMLLELNEYNFMKLFNPMGSLGTTEVYIFLILLSYFLNIYILGFICKNVRR